MQRTARAAWDLAASLSLYAATVFVVWVLFLVFTVPDGQGGIVLVLLPAAFLGANVVFLLLIWPPLAIAVAWRYRAELLAAKHPARAVAYRVLLPLVTWVSVVRQLVVTITSTES